MYLSNTLLICQNCVNFFRGLVWKKKKFDDSSRLDIVEIACFPDMLPSLFPSYSD